MSYNFDSVRAKIRNKCTETGLKPDILYNRYLLERFICRIAESEHTDSIVIKGGLLISAITGIDLRATRDLDATIIGNVLERSEFEKLVCDIISIDLDDNIFFKFVGTEEIMQDNNYPCYRIHLRAEFGSMNAKLEIDMTTGDAITPKEINFGFPSLFANTKIPVLAYNIETILAEKLTAILDLNVYNTRAKDFYDVYLLKTSFENQIDRGTLHSAVCNTLESRGKTSLLNRINDIVPKIITSENIISHWNKYQDEYPYAKDIDFIAISRALIETIKYAGFELPLENESLKAKLQRYQKVADEHNSKSSFTNKTKNEPEI